MSGKYLVPISKLADYAADPAGYCKRQGGIINAKAIKAGNKGHDNFGKAISSFRIILVLGFAIVFLLMVIN